jgi:hypothetical protein
MFKVEIFQKNETFIDDLLNFIFDKSPLLKRDNYIDNILNDEVSVTKNIDYIKKIGKIEVNDVFGSTFQSYHRSNENIYAISHNIHFIEFNGDKIYGLVEPSIRGDVIDFTKGILQPVYYRPDVNSRPRIATFDIDFNITNNAA